jgi:hypothetical protein
MEYWSHRVVDWWIGGLLDYWIIGYVREKTESRNWDM